MIKNQKPNEFLKQFSFLSLVIVPRGSLLNQFRADLNCRLNALIELMKIASVHEKKSGYLKKLIGWKNEKKKIRKDLIRNYSVIVERRL